MHLEYSQNVLRMLYWEHYRLKLLLELIVLECAYCSIVRSLLKSVKQTVFGHQWRKAINTKGIDPTTINQTFNIAILYSATCTWPLTFIQAPSSLLSFSNSLCTLVGILWKFSSSHSTHYVSWWQWVIFTNSSCV